MVSRWQTLCIIAHEIWHDCADASLFVIKHDRCATVGAGAKLQRPIGILSVEWLSVQTIEVIDFDVAVIKKDDMSRILPSNVLTYRTVASVDVYRTVI